MWREFGVRAREIGIAPGVRKWNVDVSSKGNPGPTSIGGVVMRLKGLLILC